MMLWMFALHLMRVPIGMVLDRLPTTWALVTAIVPAIQPNIGVVGPSSSIVLAPWNRIDGHWLESAGFKVGASASIEATPGQLVVTLIEFPEEARQSNSTTFEKHIGKRGRTNPDSEVIHEHPGWLVRELILAPMGASTSDFAHAIGVSQDFAECFLAGDQYVDLDLAQHLGPLCRTSQAPWLELQLKHRSIR